MDVATREDPDLNLPDPPIASSSPTGERNDPPHRVTASSRIPAWLPGPLLLFPLSVWALTRRGPFWFDEAVSMAATKNLAETLVETSGTMGLYYLALTPWSWLNDSAAWLRAPSILFMTIACGLFAALVGRQHGAQVGRLAGAIAGVSSLPIWYAAEARSYGLLAMVVALAWYSLDRAIGDDDRGWLWIFVLCAAVTPFVHGLGVIQVAAQLGAVIWVRPGSGVLRKVLLGAALSSVAAGVLLVVGINDVAQWVPPLTAEAAIDFATSMIHPDALLAVVLLLVIAVGVGRLLRLPRSTPVERFRFMTLLAWGPGTTAMLLCLSVLRPAQITRYGLPAAFAFAGLVALGISALNEKLRWYAACSLVALIAATTVTTVHRMNNEPWDQTISAMAANAEPGDQVVFGTPVSRITFEAAWVHGDGPPLNVVGPGLDLGRFDRFGDTATVDEIEASINGGVRLWLVDQPRRSQASRGPDLIDSLTSSGWRVVDRWEPGSAITIVLLEPHLP